MSDLEAVPGVMSAILRRESSGELVLAPGLALEVIEACSSSGVAVLGIEMFPGLNVSTYDQHLKAPADEKLWSGYVRANKALAEDFLRKNLATSTECILTTASWREFCEIQRESEKL